MCVLLSIYWLLGVNKSTVVIINRTNHFISRYYLGNVTSYIYIYVSCEWSNLKFFKYILSVQNDVFYTYYRCGLRSSIVYASLIYLYCSYLITLSQTCVQSHAIAMQLNSRNSIVSCYMSGFSLIYTRLIYTIIFSAIN